MGAIIEAALGADHAEWEGVAVPEVWIRQASTFDNELLARLGRDAFPGNFEGRAEPSGMDAHIDARYSPEIQAAELAHPRSAFFVAHVDSEPAGFARVRDDDHPAALSSQRALEIHRLYVLREYWSSGVGQALMAACLEEARAREVDVVWLAAWSENLRTVRFYESHGFIRVGSQPYVLGDETHLDYIFERRVV